MDRIDLDCFKQASRLLKRYGFQYLDCMGRLKIGDPEVITIDDQTFDIAKIEAETKPDAIVDPVILSDFEKLFKLLVKGWPPERRGNIHTAKALFFDQAKAFKFTQAFIDGFEMAMNGYSQGNKEKQYWTTIEKWLPTWENWSNAYVANVSSGEWKAIKTGAVWDYLKGLK